LRYTIVLLLAAASFHGVAQTKTSPTKTTPTKATPAGLKTRADSLGYALGRNLGEFLKANGVTDVSKDISTDMLIKALKDATGSTTSPMTREQCATAINTFVTAKKSESMSKNKVAGEKFLAANKTKPGVITLPSGLQYQVIKEGTGPKPTASDMVQVHYHGTLIDGTIFDSSVDRNEPITHSASGFIPGWNEALLLMPTGSKWKLWVPSNLAYGDSGAGPQIGPGSALVFDVELLKVNP
jgi:FKBP-type peptidyl-prolyl cis-trans isomerase FklB